MTGHALKCKRPRPISIRRSMPLNLSPDRPLHRDGDPYDDGPLPDLTSGLMWFATGVIALAALALPGSTHGAIEWVVGLSTFATVWGVVSIVLGLRGVTMALGARALVTAATLPVVALGLWATGGASSYLQAVLIFPALFIAWFFPARLAWPLVALFLAAFASPLVYDADAVEVAYPARALMFSFAVIGSTLALQNLKVRHVRAEVRQRSFAELDPLTGVRNRRGFDQALARAEQQQPEFALVLLDLDDFKSINDVHGHPTGDIVLRTLAHAAQTVVRQGDCLARIGGDEFALVAPGAGEAGIERLVRKLKERVALAPMPEGLGPVGVTFASAVAPADGESGAELLSCADERLLASKRVVKAVAPAGVAG